MICGVVAESVRLFGVGLWRLWWFTLGLKGFGLRRILTLYLFLHGTVLLFGGSATFCCSTILSLVLGDYFFLTF